MFVFKADEVVGPIYKALLPPGDDNSPGTSGLQCGSHGSLSPSEHIDDSVDMASDVSSSISGPLDHTDFTRTGYPSVVVLV